MRAVSAAQIEENAWRLTARNRTSTYSMTSSVAERLEENGRTYHSYKDGKYLLPNDEAELDRLGMSFS